MADRKISELTALTLPTADDLLAIVNAGETKKITYANLINVHYTYSAIDTLNLVAGSSASALSDLQTMLDGNVYHIDEAAGVPGFDLRLSFINMDAVDFIVVRFYYAGSTTHGCRVQIYNTVTTNWDTLLTASGAAVDHTLYRIPILNDINYISTGNVSIRFYHAESGNSSHDLYIDYASIGSVQ